MSMKDLDEEQEAVVKELVRLSNSEGIATGIEVTARLVDTFASKGHKALEPVRLADTIRESARRHCARSGINYKELVKQLSSWVDN